MYVCMPSSCREDATRAHSLSAHHHHHHHHRKGEQLGAICAVKETSRERPRSPQGQYAAGSLARQPSDHSIILPAHDASANHLPAHRQMHEPHHIVEDVLAGLRSRRDPDQPLKGLPRAQLPHHGVEQHGLGVAPQKAVHQLGKLLLLPHQLERLEVAESRPAGQRVEDLAQGVDVGAGARHPDRDALHEPARRLAHQLQRADGAQAACRLAQALEVEGVSVPEQAVALVVDLATGARQRQAHRGPRLGPRPSVPGPRDDRVVFRRRFLRVGDEVELGRGGVEVEGAAARLQGGVAGREGWGDEPAGREEHIVVYLVADLARQVKE